MNAEEFVNDYLQPRLQGDGGWVELISYDENTLRLRFRGECSKCMILDRCVDWCRSEAKRLLGDVTIKYERKRPYFQDA